MLVWSQRNHIVIKIIESLTFGVLPLIDGVNQATPSLLVCIEGSKIKVIHNLNLIINHLQPSILCLD